MTDSPAKGVKGAGNLRKQAKSQPDSNAGVPESERNPAAFQSAVGVRLRVVPNAKKTEVTGLHGDAVKLKVASPALEGKANAEVLQFVAGTAGVPVRMAELISGEKSRDKVVRVHGMPADVLRLMLLGPAIPS